MDTSFLRDLAATWRSEAVLYRRRGWEVGASLTESLVADLEAGLEVFEEETLTLTQASGESGYTPDHLGRLVRNGKIPNAGLPNAPRIRRGDLPSKSSSLHPDPTPGHLGSTKTEIVRSVVSSKGAGDG